MNAQRELFVKKTKKEDGEKRKIETEMGWGCRYDRSILYTCRKKVKSNAIFLIMKRGGFFFFFLV